MEQHEKCLRWLVQHVLTAKGLPKPVPYQKLAFEIGRLDHHGRGHAHGLGHILGKMGYALQALEERRHEPIPHIQSLVVKKTGSLKGLPDTGIDLFWPDYQTLSKQEKYNKVRAEYQRIKDYGHRWNDILQQLDLLPVLVSSTPSYRRGGGESEHHLALKQYIQAHPHIVGANANDAAHVEYAFPSLDKVDVLFQGADRWLAVEVKSHISDEKDYERGLYQCVKYRALLQAMQQDERYPVSPGHTIEAVLVLETALPDPYQPLARLLGIRVIPNIKP